MDINTAAIRINTALTRLEHALGESMFDEWVLVRKGPEGWKIVKYTGPRETELEAGFSDDLEALRQVLDLSKVHAGDFAFVHDGYGSAYDAYMGVGEGVLVLFNHTVKTTGDLTADPRWKAAQIHFSDLLEAFLADPVG